MKKNKNNKKVVVIGGSGFIGSHVADALTDAGYDVAIFDLKASPYKRKNQKMIIGDIMNKNSLNKALKDVFAVYHYAGVADLKEATEKPYETFNYNTLGTINVLQACLANKVHRFIFASSVYVYSDAGSFYRISKLASELIIDEFQKRYGLEYTILRYGSLYGPRADLRNGIYRLLHQAITKGKITYYGTKNDRREYIHVYEAARLSVEILKEKYKNQHITLTGHQVLTSLQLLTMIKEMLKNKVDFKILPPRSFINYSITPYTFTPRLGKKLVSNDFMDIGEGMLRLIEEIYKEKNKNNYHELINGSSNLLIE